MKLHSLIATFAAATLAAVSCCTTNQNELSIVPYPNNVEIKCGNFCVPGATFHLDTTIDAASENAIKALAAQISIVTGQESAVAEGCGKSGFVFKHSAELPFEAYTLSIKRKVVEVKASSLNGFNYAIQSIKQMLPVEIFGKEAAADKDWKLQCAHIEDAPRFGYRGMHLDVSRHFYTVEEVKRFLDIMEVHKLNTFHWHLTDDQGWRLEIKKYPKLTEVGSIRNKTIIGHIFQSKKYDNTPYGEGMWYSQDEVRDIIAYAASKGITVIPEIDLPGHMLAALAAYPELGCKGKKYEVWGDWGVADDVICAGKESAMIFLEDVLDEVCELFPSEYIHIGGDECPKVRWEKCPKCQAKIRELGLKDDDKHQAEHFLQSYVMERMEKFINSKGKRIIGWDEILEGKVAPNATIMSWRGVSGGLQAVQLGHDAIMTPNTFFYLDYYQSLDKDNEPLAIGGYLPVEKCYSYEPFVEGMTDEQKAHILGVQANLWTEYIPTESYLHYMLLPRMAALSEVQWCQPENKSWERFHNSADNFCAIYDIMGYNYAKHIFDADGDININKEKGCVEVTLKAQGTTPIRYTLDGSEPTAESPLYTAPLEIRESCTLKAKSEIEGSRTFEKTFHAHKAMGRPAKTLTETHPSYTFNCPDLLTDGVRGYGMYNSGDFAGWWKYPFEVIIDMGGVSYSEVTLCAFVFKHDYIFNPQDMVIYTSEDGENFTEVARAEYGLSGGANDGNGNNEYTLSFPETSAKYLKVTAKTLEALPEWHTGKGRPGFVFIDEVMVN